jgi:hypothetical protein
LNISATVLSIMLLLLISTSSLLLVVLSTNNKGTIITLAQAKKKEPTSSSLSSSHHIRTTTSNSNTANTIHTSKSNRHLHKDKSQNLHSATPTTATMTTSSSLSPSSERPHDIPAPSPEEQQSIVQRLYSASAVSASDNGDSTNNNNFISQIDQQQQTTQQQQQQQSCLDSSYIDRFILPLKEARFTHIRPCVTVTGTVLSAQKINADGDITFNIVVDPPYEEMLGPGNVDPSHSRSSQLHIEVICQEPVISKAPMDAGACDGYNGPDFHSSLPTGHEHVMITGRFQIEWNEAPSGLTEIHPIYDIKTIPKT